MVGLQVIFSSILFSFFLYFLTFLHWTLYRTLCRYDCSWLQVTKLQTTVVRQWLARTNVWNFHGFSFMALTWPLLPSHHICIQRRKGNQKDQCLSQENKSFPRDSTTDWCLIGQICVTWLQLAGKRKREGSWEMKVESTTLQWLPQTHIAFVIKK